MNEKSTSLVPPFYFQNSGENGGEESFTLRDLLGVRAWTFLKRHGITIAALFFLTLWTWTVTTIATNNARHDTRVELEAEYQARITAFYEEQEAERIAANQALLSDQAQMEREADALARLIGTMKTRRMKQTMIWNVLVRVDNPNYPGSVEEVIAQPQQWMFYDPKNPIREDDRALALEQLAIWHDGRYPAGLSRDFVYAEWSESDYVLRDTWDKSSATMYWRMPE